eukprot:COSAG04_NODE_23233_length_341_cov_1.892562_1_plen_54_part_01
MQMDPTARFEAIKKILRQGNGPKGQLFTNFTSWPGSSLKESNRASEGPIAKPGC